MSGRTGAKGRGKLKLVPTSGAPTAEELRASFEAATSRCERIEIPAIGAVYMRKVSGDMRWALLEIQQTIKPNADGKKRLPPKLVIAVALCDASGQPLYEIDVGIRWVGSLDSEVQDELFAHALRVTGLGSRAVEDAEKKSSSSQSKESGTTSPSSSEAAP